MKRLLVFLLVLILPVCALAETYEVSLEVNTDDEVFAVYAKELLQMILGLTAEDEDEYVQLLRALLRDSEVTAVAQDDAVSMEVKLAGGSLIDAIVRQTETASYLTSSLLPGYVLVDESIGAAADEQITMDESAMQRAVDSIEAALSNWLSDVEPTTTRGVFRGDAYEGGTQCATWILSDKDIAACLSAFATDEVRSLLTQILTSEGVDVANLLAQFDEANDRVADEDKYIYVLRVVRDDADRFVGLSLTVTEEISQLATISFGLTDKEARLVIGLGLDAQNYWWEYTVQENQRDHLTFLKGSSREWVADKFESFAYVSETNAPVAAYNWNCNITESGQRYLWDGSLYAGDTTDASKAICSFSGAVNSSSSSFETSISLMRASRTPLKLKIGYKPVEAIPPMDTTLTQCSLSDPAQVEMYHELSNMLSFELSARLINLLPLDVIMTLNDMINGY